LSDGLDATEFQCNNWKEECLKLRYDLYERDLLNSLTDYRTASVVEKLRHEVEVWKDSHQKWVDRAKNAEDKLADSEDNVVNALEEKSKWYSNYCSVVECNNKLNVKSLMNMIKPPWLVHQSNHALAQPLAPRVPHQTNPRPCVF
jgi:hypothetical protein